MKKITLFALVTVLVTMFSLTSATAQDLSKSEEDKMYKDMGIELCECMKPIFALDKEKEEEGLSDLKKIEEMRSVFIEAEKCTEKLTQKYSKIDFESSSNPKAEKALVDNCPELRAFEQKMIRDKEAYEKAKEVKEGKEK